MANHQHGSHGHGAYAPTPLHFPWTHIIGYILSLLLTLGAFAAVLNHLLSGSWLVTVIMLLAVLQIAVQLFLFMHFTEGEGPRYHIMAISLGLLFTVIFVGGSLWIMTFGDYQTF